MTKPEKLAFKYREIFKAQTGQVKTAHEPKGHFYVSPTTREKYHSVTYFTSFIKDPSLANYKMNRAIDYVRQNIELNVYHSENSIFKVTEDAKAAPESTFLNAGDIGTQTHNWRQEWFQNWIDLGVGSLPDADIDAYPLPENADPEVISGCRAIKKFLKETGYIPVACELALVDDELKVGGCIDDLGVFPNKKSIIQDVTEPWQEGSYKVKYFPELTFVDLKTSNQGKKPAYAYQVRGFYQRMIKKTFKIKPKKTYILHTSKEDGTYKLIDLTDMSFLEKDCADLVRLSRSWDGVVESFKPKQIVI